MNRSTEPSGSSQDSRMATGEAGAEIAAASPSYSQDPDPHSPGGDDGHRSIPSSDADGAKGEGFAPFADQGGAQAPSHPYVKSERAVTLSHLPEPIPSSVKADSTDGGTPPPPSVQPIDAARKERNERCQGTNPKCAFAYASHGLACANCATAWTIKQRKERAAA